MDTSRDLCDAMGSHSEASSDLDRAKSSQKEDRVTRSKGLSDCRGKAAQAVIALFCLQPKRKCLGGFNTR